MTELKLNYDHYRTPSWMSPIPLTLCASLYRVFRVIFPDRKPIKRKHENLFLEIINSKLVVIGLDFEFGAALDD